VGAVAEFDEAVFAPEAVFVGESDVEAVPVEIAYGPGEENDGQEEGEEEGARFHGFEF